MLHNTAMQRGACLRYVGAVAITLGLVLLFLVHGSSKAPTAAVSSKLHEYYGLQPEHSSAETESAFLEAPAANPHHVNVPQHQGEEPPSSSSPVPKDLPRDAFGQISDTLTEEQCTQGFPDLYHQIERSVHHWSTIKHTIGPEDVNITWRADPKLVLPGGAVRFLIHKNQLRVLESIDTIGMMGYDDRANGILHLIQRALNAATLGGEVLPTIEAALVLQDRSDPPTEDGTHSFWTMAANKNVASHNRLWLVPNFDFWGDMAWGAFDDAKRKAADQDAAFTSKIQSAVWRGNAFWNMEVRQKLRDVAEGRPWADVVNIPMDRPKAHLLETSEYCKYAMTIHTEGVSYSGRLTQLLLCNSLPIVHDLEWMTHYYHLLKDHGPDQNYVSARRDWSNLESVATYYLEHPEEAEKIIANSLATFRNRYLSKAATSCYIRKLIKGYSSVSFKPKVERAPTKGGVRKLRGASFEVLSQAMHKDYTDENKDIIDLWSWP